MPEAVPASLPTAGTVPHTDDDSSPDLISITPTLPTRMQYGASTRAVVGHVKEEMAFHSSTGKLVCQSWLVWLSGVVLFFIQSSFEGAALSLHLGGLCGPLSLLCFGLFPSRWVFAVVLWAEHPGCGDIREATAIWGETCQDSSKLFLLFFLTYKDSCF